MLEILKNFKKPKIEPFVDAANNNTIVERIEEIEGVKQTEQFPFFRDYQIFISTYDRFWFGVAKNWVETKSPNRWCYFELFANKKEHLSFNTPILYESMNYLQRANYYLSKHNYPDSANNLRKALEQRIKELLPANEHYGEYLDAVTGITEIKKLKTLNQYLERFIGYCDANSISASELADLKNLKDWYFNPFSHDNIATPIFRREIELAKNLVERLGNFEFKILLPAGARLFFRFDDNAGQTREYKVELQENLRWIRSALGVSLTNPAIIGYEWTRNGTVPD